MLRIGDEFPVQPGDKVRINGKYPDLESYRDRYLIVGATGWVCGTPVVWLHGEGAPLGCVALDGIDRIEVMK